MSQRGFTLNEVLLAMAIGGLVLAISVPAMTEVLRRTRLNSATRQLVNDVRETRARAVMSGWEYRLVGYADGAVNRSNQYRVIGRSSTEVAWPAENSGNLSTATQIAEPWIDLGIDYADVILTPNNVEVDDRFEITFNSQGAATMTNDCFDPFDVSNTKGDSRQVRVTPGGSVRTD